MFLQTKTEFGTFYVRQIGEYHTVSLGDIDIGWIRTPLVDDETLDNIRQVFSRFIETYLLILRTEAKISMFIDLPLANEFKDAVLRSQLEGQGQTLEVRKFIEDYDGQNNWITYPKEAEFYILDELVGISSFAFITPYGRYHLDRISASEYQLIRFREGSESHIVEIGIPYNLLEKDLLQTAWLQAIEALHTDTIDAISRKLREVGKRTSESIKYIFGYDKLRLSLRNRGI